MSSFEQRYARFPGPNLTFEVREGMVKHSPILRRANSRNWRVPARVGPPLEAQLIDLADEVAYNTADLATPTLARFSTWRRWRGRFRNTPDPVGDRDAVSRPPAGGYGSTRVCAG